jgi:hypothetical protein
LRSPPPNLPRALQGFAREFIETTFLWSPFWLNERVLARRPWLHEGSYVKVDQILQQAIPEYFRQRQLQSEYAMMFAMYPIAAREEDDRRSGC